MEPDNQLVDGFLYSASLLYLPTVYRASALAQMEVLRRARAYRTRWYLAPEDYEQPIPAFSQNEYQVQVMPGTYIWGMTFSAPFGEVELASSFIHVQVTDACTETPLFSDYLKGVNLEPIPGNDQQEPFLIMPRLIGEPGLINVELYNGASEDIRCQLALLVAEPAVPPREMQAALIAAGYVEVLT